MSYFSQDAALTLFSVFQTKLTPAAVSEKMVPHQILGCMKNICDQSDYIPFKGR